MHSHVWRAVLRSSHPGSLLQPLAKLFIYVETGIGGCSCGGGGGGGRHALLTETISWECKLVFLSVSLTQREDLPQQNTERPHVALGGEHLVKDGLWGHPLERETGLRANQNAGERSQETLK